MKAVLITTYKTKRAADRLAADWLSGDLQEMHDLHLRVIERNGVYCIVRDCHPSDAGRSFEIIDVKESAR